MFRNRVISNASNQMTAVPSPNRVSAAGPKQAVNANFGPAAAGNPLSVSTFGAPAFSTIFQGILPEYNENALLQYYRDCYYYDSVGGATVDLSASFPFSDWSLTGLDTEDLDVFNESLSRLHFRSLFQEISNCYLVDGAFIGTLIYDSDTKTFQDILIHDTANAAITFQPFHSLDPVITVNSAPALSQIYNSNSPYVDNIMAAYPKAIVDKYLAGNVILDPLTTIYIPRRGLRDKTHVSYLKRLLPVYMLEKILFRGTVTEAHKRQRATSHIKAGDDSWIPTDSELSGILAEFQRSELDPLGAWLITRQGVDVTDVRPGGDFWKWTDNIDTLTPFKLRALGISEAFLSGDASYACLSGDTLIPTTEGLRRIDSFGEGRDRKKVFKIDSVMDSRYGPQKASSWQYNGYQETLEVRTEIGNRIKATGNHPLLVFDGEKTVWKRTDSIKVGDILCVSRNKVVRTSPLELNTPRPEPRKRKLTHLNRSGNRTGMVDVPQNSYNPGSLPKLPKRMTPKLAYWLSLLISEGYTSGEDKVSSSSKEAFRIGFKNTDQNLVSRFILLGKELFGITASGGDVELSADHQNKSRTKSSFLSTKSSWSCHINNRMLIDWLQDIGVYLTPGKVEGKTPSYYKEVPWSILEADEKSQIAFLAGYAECDGSIGDRTVWLSVSKNFSSQLQCILNSHGYQPTFHKRGSLHVITLQGRDSQEFWSEASKFLSSKKFTGNPTYSKLDGLPAKHWKDLILSRKRGFNRHGQFFERDDGSVFQTSTRHSLDQISFYDLKRFNYDRYKDGFYDGFLDLLKDISPNSYSSLVTALSTPYRFTEVTAVKKAGKEHVYDISMPKGTEPAFVANGLVVHNTAEAAISVFLESMDSYRQFITYKIFSSKLFPLISVLHGLYRDSSLAKPNTEIGNILYNLHNTKNLKIPTVRWFKSLNAKDTESQWDMLDKLSEKGFTIPLKMWSAAASIDIGTLLRDLEEDRVIRQSIEKITGKPFQHNDNPDDMSMEAASMRPLPGSTLPIRSVNSPDTARSVPLLKRNFGKVNPGRLSKSGKVLHASMSETADRKRGNEFIMKAMKNLSDPNYRESLRRKVQSKYGAGSVLDIVR